MRTDLAHPAARGASAPVADDVVRPHTAAPAPTAALAMTVAKVLEVGALRVADPEVVAGAAGLDRPVRWVHTTELSDVAALLRGGDLVLSTGIALSDGAAELTAFAESLDRCDAAGLVVELGRRWSALPAPLVQACDRLGLPLVALHREVRFAEVGQAVGELIVDEQLEELREAQRVHEVFTELGMAEAGPAEILEAVQRLAGATVVLEDGQHRLVDYRSGPGDTAGFLTDWQRRSRAVHLDRRTAWDACNGWLLTRVGRPERSWGRLVIQSAVPPPPRLVATAERAAAALALHNLHDRQRDSLVRRTHAEILTALLRDPTATEVLQRCELAGLPVGRRTRLSRWRSCRLWRASAAAALSAVATSRGGGGTADWMTRRPHERSGRPTRVRSQPLHASHAVRRSRCTARERRCQSVRKPAVSPGPER